MTTLDSRSGAYRLLLEHVRDLTTPETKLALIARVEDDIKAGRVIRGKMTRALVMEVLCGAAPLLDPAPRKPKPSEPSPVKVPVPISEALAHTSDSLLSPEQEEVLHKLDKLEEEGFFDKHSLLEDYLGDYLGGKLETSPRAPWPVPCPVVHVYDGQSQRYGVPMGTYLVALDGMFFDGPRGQEKSRHFLGSRVNIAGKGEWLLDRGKNLDGLPMVLRGKYPETYSYRTASGWRITGYLLHAEEGVSLTSWWSCAEGALGAVNPTQRASCLWRRRDDNPQAWLKHDLLARLT